MHFLSTVLPFMLLPLVSSLTCNTHSTSPSLASCRKALKEISPKPAKICATIFRPTYVAAEYGGCVIATYSKAGDAHCIDGKKVIAAVEKVLAGCAHNGKVQGKEGITHDPSRGVKVYGKGIVP